MNAVSKYDGQALHCLWTRSFLCSFTTPQSHMVWRWDEIPEKAFPVSIQDHCDGWRMCNKEKQYSPFLTPSKGPQKEDLLLHPLKKNKYNQCRQKSFTVHFHPTNKSNMQYYIEIATLGGNCTRKYRNRGMKYWGKHGYHGGKPYLT